LAFCDDQRRRELRIVAAMMVALQCTHDPRWFARPNFEWPYRISLKGAIQNLFKEQAVAGNLMEWRRSGVVGEVRVLHSADGPCDPCRRLSLRAYCLETVPDIPHPLCTNTDDGCRCGLIASKIRGLSRIW
jgi:hypothetical protein